MRVSRERCVVPIPDVKLYAILVALAVAGSASADPPPKHDASRIEIAITRSGFDPGNVIVPAGGIWVRDQCHELPQAEVCARLSDRRYEILRRYGSAMPSERRTLDLEQRGIDARMANDCGNP